MEVSTLEVDYSLLREDSSKISRESFVDLLNFRNQKFIKTKFHTKFLDYLENIRVSRRREFSISGIQGIGKSFTLFYFMLSHLKNRDNSVHYIDLDVPGFDIELFGKYAKQIGVGDLLIIDHVTIFNIHHAKEIQKNKQIVILTVETGFSASSKGKTLVFGKDYELREEEFNQMWMAQNESLKVDESGEGVFRLCATSELMTPRLLHTFYSKLYDEGSSLLDAYSQYQIQQRNDIVTFLESELSQRDEYWTFLLHSSYLLSIIPKNGNVILTKPQFEAVRVAINIFTFCVSLVTDRSLKEDGRILEAGLEENEMYYTVSHLVPSLAELWKERLPYNVHFVLESKKWEEVLSIISQLGGGRKEIKNIVLTVQKKQNFMILPADDVFTSMYRTSQEDSLIAQVKQTHTAFEGAVYSVNMDVLHSFDTPFSCHKKNVAQCAMWIKKKIHDNPNETFIVHPDIPNFMGIDYFCKAGTLRKTDQAKQLKREDCLYLMHVATGHSHTGKAIGEALDVVKEVFTGESLTIHIVIIIVHENEMHPYRLTKCQIQDASVINISASVFTNRIKDSHRVFYEFIHKLKHMNV